MIILIILRIFLASVIFNLILLPHMYYKISNENNLSLHLHIILSSVFSCFSLNLYLLVIYLGLLKHIIKGSSTEYWEEIKNLYYSNKKEKMR